MCSGIAVALGTETISSLEADLGTVLGSYVEAALLQVTSLKELPAETLSTYTFVVCEGEPPRALVDRCAGAANLPLLAIDWTPSPVLASPLHVVSLSRESHSSKIAGLRELLRLVRERTISLGAMRIIADLIELKGPFTHRASSAVEGLAKLIGATQIALYLAEKHGQQVIPLLARFPLDTSFTKEIVLPTPTFSRLFKAGSPCILEDRLAVPIGPLDRADGLLLLTGPEGAYPRHASPSQISLIGSLIIKTLQAERFREVYQSSTDTISIDRDQLFQVEKLASLGQLAAGVAHEINNPLFVITGNLEMAVEMVSDTPRTLLSKAIKAADRIKKIVFDMRQFFLPAARRELVLPIDLNELADSAIKIVSLQPSMKNMMFNREFVSRPPRVMGDDNQLLQVFTNLFLNAAQASPNGGTISIATSVEPPFIVCRIADNGVGIPQENLARIFDPFFTTKRDWYGTGLGLSVSYTIIKNHSGTISATSTEGKGTTFTIRLPLMRDSVNAPAPVVEEPTGPESRPRILVVDDEDNVRDYLEYLLGESGYLVDSTSDGAVAIRMMEEHHYPVIILDQIMPGLSGLETFRHIQTIDPDCHVILLTGAAEMQAPEVLAEGLYKVLMKPCRGETVLKVVSAGIAGEPAPD